MGVVAQIIDGTYGRPATDVKARLEHAEDSGWESVADAETDSNGWIGDWSGRRLERGLYRIVFEIGRYFATLGTGTAYPEVVVVFRMRGESDSSQVRLTLSPYAYAICFGTAEKEK